MRCSQSIIIVVRIGEHCSEKCHGLDHVAIIAMMDWWCFVAVDNKSFDG